MNDRSNSSVSVILLDTSNLLDLLLHDNIG